MIVGAAARSLCATVRSCFNCFIHNDCCFVHIFRFFHPVIFKIHMMHIENQLCPQYLIFRTS